MMRMRKVKKSPIKATLANKINYHLHKGGTLTKIKGKWKREEAEQKETLAKRNSKMTKPN